MRCRATSSLLTGMETSGEFVPAVDADDKSGALTSAARAGDVANKVRIHCVAKAASPTVVFQSRAEFCRADVFVGRMIGMGDQHNALVQTGIAREPII